VSAGRLVNRSYNLRLSSEARVRMSHYVSAKERINPESITCVLSAYIVAPAPEIPSTSSDAASSESFCFTKLTVS
jgi:hypothetical protein